MDFQPVDHAIDAKKFIRGLQEACDTQSGGDLEKAVKGKLKQLAREQFLDDKQEAENKDRGNLKVIFSVRNFVQEIWFLPICLCRMLMTIFCKF